MGNEIKKVNIAGLDKAAVLLALWKGSHCQGMSFLGMMGAEKGMDIERAKEIVKQRAYWEWKYTQAQDKTDLPNDLNEVSEEDKEAFEAWYATDPSFRCDFDYVDGHVIKCDITGDQFDPGLYDRDCGEGKAEKVIAALRNGKEIVENEDAELDFFKCLIKAFAGADRERSSERHDPAKPVHMVDHADILHEENDVTEVETE